MDTIIKEIGELIGRLNTTYGMTYEDIGRAAKMKDANLPASKSTIARMRGGGGFERGTGKAERWLNALRSIEKEAQKEAQKAEPIAQPGLHNLLGFYIGYYWSTEGEGLRKVLMQVWDKGRVEMRSDRLYYSGDIFLNGNFLFMLMVDRNRTHTVFFCSGMGNSLAYEVHLAALILHYSYGEGSGVVSGRCIFFHEGPSIGAFDAQKEQLDRLLAEPRKELEKKAGELMTRYTKDSAQPGEHLISSRTHMDQRFLQ